MCTFLCGLYAAAVVMASGPGGVDQSAATATAAQAGFTVPGWLWGVWQREWIEERGSRSSTLDVHYLQTPTFFADVRIPLDRPRFPRAVSFADLGGKGH